MFQPLPLNHLETHGECALFNKRCGQKSIQKIVSSEEQNDVWREFDEQLFYRFNFVWGNHTESLHTNEKRDV